MTENNPTHPPATTSNTGTPDGGRPADGLDEVRDELRLVRLDLARVERIINAKPTPSRWTASDVYLVLYGVVLVIVVISLFLVPAVLR